MLTPSPQTNLPLGPQSTPTPTFSGLNPIQLHSVQTGRGAPVVEADIIHWLLTESRHIDDVTEFVDELCWRIVGAGVPLWRVTLHIGTLHPQILGFGCRWRRDRNTTEVIKVAHSVIDTDDFIRSPIRRVVLEGATERYDTTDPALRERFPLLDSLAAEGATDYFAAPLSLSVTGNRYQAVSWASDSPSGFGEADIAFITRLMPALSTLVEMRAVRRIGASLLDTYLGRQVGPRILGGQIRRGIGERMRAVVLASDLRGFTRLSDRLPGEEVIEILDDYFERIAEPVHERGGDVLKFVGDGVLAIFPSEDGAEQEATESALGAAVDGLARLEEFNAGRRSASKPAIQAGIGLHVGDVIYGNVGAPTRLDFTAIGPAVNLACRLEGLTKRVGRPLLTSGDFAKSYRKKLVSLGFHPVRGLSEPQELFTVDGPG